MTNGRARSAAIDAVRVAGVLAVAAGHLWGGAPEDSNPVRIAIYSWQVPIFFFLTGYLWTRGRPLPSEVTNRARSLLVPYAAWTLLIGLPLVALAVLTSGSVPWEQIGLTIWGGGLVRGWFAPYWFLPLLFLVAVLVRILERFPRWLSWALALVGLIACYPLGEELARLPQDIFFVLPCMIFTLIGQEVRRLEPHLPSGWPRFFMGISILAVSGVLLASGVAQPLDIKLGNFGTPIASVLVSVAICMGLVAISQAALDSYRGRFAPLITELATVSVVVLLTHTFLFVAYGRLGFPTSIMFVLTIFTSFALGAVIHRTNLSPLLAGVPRKVGAAQGRTKTTS